MKGSDPVSRVPKTITINEDEVREALFDCIGTIVQTVRTCLERTPPEIAADMVDNGVVLTGGGALLTGLDDIIHKETYLPVSFAPNPLSCVALGVGALLEDMGCSRASRSTSTAGAARPVMREGDPRNGASAASQLLRGTR